jgi:hypothetical protein
MMIVAGVRPTLYCHRVIAMVAALAVLASLADAQQSESRADPRWEPIHRVFGQGDEEEGYYRVNLPRSDLHVSIEGDTLSPGFEFTSYVGFAPMGAKNVMAMSEVIVLQSEVPAVLAEAHRQGIKVTAMHNHLLNEQPRIMYIHATAEGAPAAVAAKFRAVFARTATPLEHAEEKASSVDWSSIDAVLGTHAEAHGSIAEFVFPRREHLRMHGLALRSSGTLETASEVVFEHLRGGRVANTGELFILPSEVEPVVSALDANGLHVTALHSHMVDDQPRMYWVHWYATGDGPTLAKGVAAALAHMNSVKKSRREGAGQ